ncbi:MAG: hypothetical protein CVV56_06080 [Tenericutes bacterium HGW-Tenericutes-1]|jgi:predicted heme/steroid binding protein|nr:MAG: hypothetical protein CVV56_06080 [Tenericutes bacterium HGW-Tenericutes-1]
MKIKFAIIVVLLGITFALTGCAITTTATTASTGVTTSTTTTATTSTTTSATTQTTASTQRVFTLAELATYNGDGGSTAYIAVNGTVYDVTNVAEWNNGWHKGVHLAGTDATTAFAGSPHSASLLATLTIVGTLAD